MNFNLETFHKFDFAGSQITTHYVSQYQKLPSELWLEGSFEQEQYESCRFWSLTFGKFENQDDLTIVNLTGNRMRFLDICPEGEHFLVKMIVGTDGGTEEIAFYCRVVNVTYYRYKGMSYRNLYGTKEYQKDIDRQRYVIDKKYLIEEEEFSLPDGYSIETALYQDSAKYAFKACLQKCILKKSGKPVYEYLCTYDHSVRFMDFILHSNGRRYFPFHEDLYGLSYLDVDSLEAWHYVPEGYAHDFSYLCGESFIVTDIHYDRNTDLIAYGGCYWACPCGVMVGDFSEPLNFEPRLFDLCKIVDPDYEGYDIQFKQWQDDQLIVTVEGEEKNIPIDEILKALRNAGGKA